MNSTNGGHPPTDVLDPPSAVMENVKPPEPLNTLSDTGKSCKLFQQRFELFLDATSPDKPRSEATKTALLLSVVGEDAIEIYNFSFLGTESKHDY